MNIVLDEHGLRFSNEAPEALTQTLVQLVDVLAEASAAEISVHRVPWLFDTTTVSGRHLWEILFQEDLVDRDISGLSGGILEHLPTIPDDELVALDIDDCAGSSLTDAAGIATAVSVGRFSPSLVTTDQSGRDGILLVRVSSSDAAIPTGFSSSQGSLHTAFQVSLDGNSVTEADLEQMAERAFPNLDFATGLWSQCRRLRGGLAGAGKQLLDTLRGLNEHASRIFAEETQSDVIQTRMKIEAGLECSPESPNTHRNTAAMAERDAQFGDQVVRCEWHVKINPTYNRVHFAVDGARVKVGVLAEHLTI